MRQQGFGAIVVEYLGVARLPVFVHDVGFLGCTDNKFVDACLFILMLLHPPPISFIVGGHDLLRCDSLQPFGTFLSGLGSVAVAYTMYHDISPPAVTEHALAVLPAFGCGVVVDGTAPLSLVILPCLGV